MNYEMIYEIIFAFGVSSFAGVLLIALGIRLWEMRAAELELKRRKQNETRTHD